MINYVLSKLGLCRKSRYEKVESWCQLYQKGCQHWIKEYKKVEAQLRVEQAITKTFNDLGKDYQRALERIEVALVENMNLNNKVQELDTAARKFRELLLRAEARIAELEAKIEELEKVNKNCNEIIFQHLEPKIRQLETQLAEAQQKIEPQEKALTHYISEFGLTKEAYEILGPWVSPQQPKSEGKVFKLEEERIEREFFEARNSNDDERLRKAWTEYRKLWIQDGIFQAD